VSSPAVFPSISDIKQGGLQDSTTITSVSNQDSNNNQNQNQLRDQEQSLKSNFDFLENALDPNSNFDFDREECFTLRYDETCHNIAVGYSTGFLGIYNMEKPETDKEKIKILDAYADNIKKDKFYVLLFLFQVL